jgi:hypothetical protein
MSYSREDEMECSREVARILFALTVILLPLGSVASAGPKEEVSAATSELGRTLGEDDPDKVLSEKRPKSRGEIIMSPPFPLSAPYAAKKLALAMGGTGPMAKYIECKWLGAGKFSMAACA